jgi:hypothetical protein
MKIEISKTRNLYQSNYYKVEVQTNNELSSEDFKKIVKAIEDISSVIDPFIDK